MAKGTKYIKLGKGRSIFYDSFTGFKITNSQVKAIPKKAQTTKFTKALSQGTLVEISESEYIKIRVKESKEALKQLEKLSSEDVNSPSRFKRLTNHHKAVLKDLDGSDYSGGDEEDEFSSLTKKEKVDQLLEMAHGNFDLSKEDEKAIEKDLGSKKSSELDTISEDVDLYVETLLEDE